MILQIHMLIQKVVQMLFNKEPHLMMAHTVRVRTFLY